MKDGIWCRIIMLAMAAGIVYGAPLYVAETGDDGEDGYSWEHAKRNIQSALAASGSPIIVSNGTYTGTVSVTRSVEIHSVNGYSNTFIDGGNATTAVYIKVSSGDPVLLSGFTIQNGIAPRGGGVYVDGISDVTIENSQIRNNAATSSGRAGGGVYKAPGGGTLVLTNCLIVSNCAKVGYGGGVFSHHGEAHVYNCQIVSNTAGAGGGIAADGDSSTQSFHCCNTRIAFNTATGNGGGVYSECSIWANPSVLEDCVIEGNICNSYGGGIHQRSFNLPGPLALNRCIIRGNTAGNNGGGCNLIGPFRMTDCLISENQAGVVGGGACFLDSTHTMLFANVTIAYNAVIGGPGSYAGGVMVYGGVTNVTMINSIVYHNMQQGAYDGRTNIYMSGGSVIVFTNCCLAPLTSVVGEGNTDADPLFMNLSGNFRLQKASPCINAGLNQGWMYDAIALDLDSRSRIDRFSGKVDMGCYEYVPSGMLFSVK